jgi:hypothetical protein
MVQSPSCRLVWPTHVYSLDVRALVYIYVKIAYLFMPDQPFLGLRMALASKICGFYLVCFSCLQLLPIRFTQRNLCALENLRWSSSKNVDWKRASPDLVMVIRSACFLISQLNT